MVKGCIIHKTSAGKCYINPDVGEGELSKWAGKAKDDFGTKC